MTGRLILFDIDGTLLNVHGAGRIAFDRSLRHVLGPQIRPGRVDFAGRTDLHILIETLKTLGHPPPGPDLTRRIFRSYLHFLEEEMSRVPEDALCPGIPGLLDDLARVDGVRLGLLTGNAEGGALIKLRHFRIDDRFPVGAFGDASTSRTDLVELVIRRANARWSEDWDREDIWLVGDTPGDIHAARASGTHVAAVATGPFSLEALGALEPDLLFRDFGEPDAARRLAGQT